MPKERQVSELTDGEVGKIDVIWNLTQECPWHCNICSVSAKPIDSLRNSSELSLEEKRKVLIQLASGTFEIDFSGGDPLYRKEDFLIVKEATKVLSKDSFGVSITGARFNEEKLELCKMVGMVEFTLDTLPGIENPARPQGYTESSVRGIKKCVNKGIKTRAVTPLFPLTMRKENLESVYHFLCEQGCPEWELLRFYPVGRGKTFLKDMPTNDDYREVMDFVDNFQGFTKVIFQHSLRLLRGEGKCPAVWKSIGILPNGKVTACAWAINEQMNPINGLFYLGKLPEENLEEIIRRAREKPEFKKEAKYCRTLNFLKKQSLRRKDSLQFSFVNSGFIQCKLTIGSHQSAE